jgi:catechol 2,3-dioxygenase-like lactoylglutathione lyase family enzyme
MEATMLANNDAMATVAVKDLAAARKFYEGTLGLTPTHEEPGNAVSYRAGRSELLVYVSRYAGTSQATTVTWMMDGQLEQSVDALKAKGVKFEHYDLPDTKRVGDIHDSGYVKNAWFKDPDGNIHALVSTEGGAQ